LEKRQAHLDEEEKIVKEDVISGKVEKIKSKEILGELANFLHEDEITRFTFILNAEFSIPSQKLIDSLKAVCKKYRAIFYYKPHFSFRSLGWRAGIEFQIYARNPYLIVKNYTSFVSDVAYALYQEAEVDNL
jgi:hypothetical protein